jgi:predicted flap endonuclease-1-like 5' DNA nuclease
MTLLIGQMLGCLIIAAGIGVVVGWLLRQLSAGRLTQQSMDVAAMLRLKEQMLEKVQHQLQIQASEIHMLENKVIESEELNQSTVRELSARHDRIETLQEELAVRTRRLTALEAEAASARRRASEHETAIGMQSDETQQIQLINQATQKTLETSEQERHHLQQRIAELEAAVSETDQLRARAEELAAAQGRAHWLEVQLSDRDAEHRAALHHLNSRLAERDRRIGELEPLTQQLLEQTKALQQWEETYAHTTMQHNDQITTLQEQLAAQDRFHAQIQSDKQLLNERAKQIDDLQRRIQELDARRQDLEHQLLSAGDNKQKEMDRLRKRAVEMQAALRIKTDGGAVPPLQKPRQSGGQLSLLVEQTHSAKERSKDDLSQIHGIGPVFARTLNKMGLYNFSQIANWKPEDIDKVAKKLYTAPDRIKRDNWVNEAKRLHEQKYGQKL